MKRSNSAFSFFLALLIAGSLFVGVNIKVAEAQWRDKPVNQQVNGGMYYVWAYTTETGNKPAGHGADVLGNPYYGVLGLVSPNITVHYNAQATDVSGNVLADEAIVPVGSRIKFQFRPHNNEDIDWFGTGYYADSPDGRWITDAQSPTSEQGRLHWGGWRPRNICDEYDLVDTEENIYGLVGGRFVVRYYPPSPPASVSGSLFCNGQVISGRFVCTATIHGRPGGDNVTVYIPLNNKPSDKAFTSSEVISCTKRTAGSLTCTYPPGDPWKIPIYIPLSVNHPTKQPISVSPNLNCGTGIPDANGYITCSVTGEGPITADMTYNSTYARFYHRQYDVRIIGGLVPGCYGSNVPMNTDLDAFKKEGSDFKIPIPSQTINFSFNAVQANNAPTPPVITGPSGIPDGVDSGTSGTSYNFTASGSVDPEGDQIRYGFNWSGAKDSSGNYIVEQWIPGSGYIDNTSNPNNSQPFPKDWLGVGLQTFRVLAQDDKNGSSPWKSHTINIVANQSPDVPTVTNTFNSQGLPGVDYQFTATANDAEGNQLRYGFDWNNDAVRNPVTGIVTGIDEWTGYVSSGVPQPATKGGNPIGWSRGAHTIQVVAQDDQGADHNSPLRTHTFNIACPQSDTTTGCICSNEKKTHTIIGDDAGNPYACINNSEELDCTASEKNSCRDFNFREVAP